MAISQKKKQEKLAKKKAKRKSARASSKKSSGNFNPERFPIYECIAGDVIFAEGKGSVIIAREMPEETLACAFFLVDTYCLGVKDVFYEKVDKSTYVDMVQKQNRVEMFKKISPECGRKLVESAVLYAREIGIDPHKGYKKAGKIWGDIDPDICDRNFEFGKDGKPFFIPGPTDSPARCRQILKTLEKKCGPDGFYYLMPQEVKDM